MTKPKPKDQLRKRGRKPKDRNSRNSGRVNSGNSGQLPAPAPVVAVEPAQVKMGRPFKLNADAMTLRQVKMLAQAHSTEVEAARFLGVDDETFKDFLAREPEAAEVWEKGRAEVVVSLRRAQLRKALSGNPEMLKHLGKNMLGQIDRTATELTGKNGGPVSFQAVGDVTPEELEAARKMIEALE